MKKRKQFEKEIRQFHKQWIAEYIAKVIELKYRIYGNNKNDSYTSIYNSCSDTLIYSLEERKQIYQQVDDILTNKYQLIVANCAFDEECIYLVDIDERNKEKEEL